MNKLPLILIAVLDAAQAGGLQPENADAVFNALNEYLMGVPEEAVRAFEETVRRVLDEPT